MTLDSPLSLVKTVFLFDRLCSQLDLCWVPLLAHPNSLWCLQSKQDILHPSLNFQPDVSSIAGRWVCWDCLILRQKHTHTHTHTRNNICCQALADVPGLLLGRLDHPGLLPLEDRLLLSCGATTVDLQSTGACG